MNPNQSMQLTPSDRGHGPCKGKARALGVGAVDLPRYAAQDTPPLAGTAVPICGRSDSAGSVRF